eukprot:g3208.t1
MLTTMIDVYAECCNKGNIIQYFKELKELLKTLDTNEVKESIWIFSSLLKICARGSLTKEAIEILNEIRVNGIYSSIVCYTTLIDGISKDEKLSIEEMLTLSSKIVDDMTKEGTFPNTLTYNTLIHVALIAKDLKKAVKLFKQMKKAGIVLYYVTYGTMIKWYEKLGDPSKLDTYLKPCLDLMAECDQKRIRMDGLSYTSLLSAYANTSNLNVALKLWKRMVKEEIKLDVIAYNAMISVCLSVDEVDEAFGFLDDMIESKFRPNKVTYGTFMIHFVKTKSKAGAQNVSEKTKADQVQPDKQIINALKTLGLN